VSAEPVPPPDAETRSEILLLAGILAVLLGLLSVGILYLVLMQTGLVGIEPPEPLRYLLLALIPAFSVLYFVLMQYPLRGR
jgi:hypothetical protein